MCAFFFLILMTLSSVPVPARETVQQQCELTAAGVDAHLAARLRRFFSLRAVSVILRVPGHGDICGIQQLIRHLGYLRDGQRQEMLELIRKMLPPETASSQHAQRRDADGKALTGA